MALTKGMYGDRKPGRFGLRDAQMRPSGVKCAHNAGWYNGAGEKLGWGDLSSADLRAVAAGLEEDELFITLPEVPSHAAFRFPKLFRWVGRKGPEDAPGRTYVRRHAVYAVTRGHVHLVDHHGDRQEKAYVRDGVRIERMTEPELKKLMRNHRG